MTTIVFYKFKRSVRLALIENRRVKMRAGPFHSLIQARKYLESRG